MSRELNRENYPLVKNFCVSITRLKDDFVKSALNGHVKWKKVNEQENKRLRRERDKIKITSRWERQYLFDSDLTSSGSDLNYSSNTSGYESSSDSLFRFRPKLDNYLKLKFNCKSLEVQDMLDNDKNYKNQNNQFERFESFKFRRITNSTKDLDIHTLNNILKYLNHADRFKHQGEMISDRPIGCVNCPFTSTSVDGIITHSLVHKGICGICNLSFTTFYSYFRHVATHFQRKQLDCLFDLDYRCTHCLSMFDQETNLIKHFNDCYASLEENLVYGIRTIRFKCKICNLVDNSLSSLLDHYLQTHSQIKCSMCNQWYANLNQLEMHAFNCHKFFIDNYKCEFCSYKFTFKTAYKDHLKYKHAIIMEEFRKRCLLCSHLFSYGEDMDDILAHLADHCNLFLYECDTCEFRYFKIISFNSEFFLLKFLFFLY